MTKVLSQNRENTEVSRRKISLSIADGYFVGAIHICFDGKDKQLRTPDLGVFAISILAFTVIIAGN